MLSAAVSLLLGLAALPLAVAFTLRRAQDAPQQRYYWPTARGNVGQYGVSSYAGPKNISSSLKWRWHHPMGRAYTVTLGVVIDDKSCVYLSADDQIRKFSPNGQMLWKYKPKGNDPTKPLSIPNVPSLMDGALYGTARPNFIFSVDMATGKESWKTETGPIGSDTGFVGAYNGSLMISSDYNGECVKDFAYLHCGSKSVRSLSPVDGSWLWSFTPDTGVWNWWPNYAGDGTVGFQDMTGKAYRIHADTGKLIWKNGGVEGTYTRGSAILGPNGVLYAVGLDGPLDQFAPGSLSAYRFTDGELLWRQPVPMPPNILPVVGYLGPDKRLSVVQAIGMECQASHNDVYAFDAETGKQQWYWDGPKNPREYCAGDLEGVTTRTSLGIRQMCLPNPWSAPTIDTEGRVFLGDQDGKFYAVRDDDGDGRIDPEKEMSSFDTEAAFSSPGSAHAPGMTAIASCDGLFVFQS